MKAINSSKEPTISIPTSYTNVLYLKATNQITLRAVQYFLSVGKGIVSNEPSQTRAIFAVKRKIEKVEKTKSTQ